MQYRTPGRTGITVSHLCLGAMMFGAFGNLDHDESIRSFGASKVPASEIVEAGMTLIQMAVAFVTRHPAVTSAIIGTRALSAAFRRR